MEYLPIRNDNAVSNNLLLRLKIKTKKSVINNFIYVRGVTSV